LVGKESEVKVGVKYRQARVEDMQSCVDVFLASWLDKARRLNLPADPSPSPEMTLDFYRHILATGLFQVAEADDGVVGLACALVRGHLWYLSGFWTLPEMQGQHIGMTLLRRVWSAGSEAGASYFFVWSSVDMQAMSAYMKAGMLPGTQMLVFAGTPRLEEPPDGYAQKPLQRDFGMALDEIVLGVPREVDHDYWSRKGWRGIQIEQRGRRAGYFYLRGGAIGPASWSEDRDAEPLLSLACREAAAAVSRISLRAPGMNHAAIRFAFKSGLRLTDHNHLLLSAPFGHLDHYMPSGEELF
jgi:GNAT superfamily N-acetyltransferase